MGKKPADKAKQIENKKSTAKEKVKKPAAKKKVVAKADGKTSTTKKPCKVGGCKRDYRAKGYCVSHYRQWRHGKFGVSRYKTCTDFECKKPMALNRHGYCEEHFQNYYVKGLAAAKPAAEKAAAAPAKEAAA